MAHVRRIALLFSATALATALLLTSVLPIASYFVSLLEAAHVGVPGPSAIWSRALLSAALAVTSLGAQSAIALAVGIALSRARASLPLVLSFAAPLLVGPTVCALIWKLLLAPTGGLIPEGMAATSFLFPDWTGSPVGARIVVSGVNVWIWGMAGGAVIAALSDEESQKARSILILDGTSERIATMWALWATHREWIVLLLLTLLVENLRSFEAIHVLTAGGPGRATTTLAYTVFERGFLSKVDADNGRVEAVWIFALIALNALAVWLLLKLVNWRRSADDTP
jgi:multiple sugar transport system permease protein